MTFTVRRSGMSLPGKKYFKGRCIAGERVLHYVVWDGIYNYENAPPLQAIAMAEKMPGLQLHVKVGADAVEDIYELIAAPLDACPEADGLVVWTQDHRTYRLIVQQLTKPGCIRLT
jgi:hypothetical protein